jgi:hypothetical protein
VSINKCGFDSSIAVNYDTDFRSYIIIIVVNVIKKVYAAAASGA